MRKPHTHCVAARRDESWGHRTQAVNDLPTINRPSGTKRAGKLQQFILVSERSLFPAKDKETSRSMVNKEVV